MNKPKTPVYLDNNATTPVDPRVIEAMIPVLREHYGNPASKTHSFGWYAEELVQIAREQVAKFIGAEPDEIVFTSGATESNNLAILGSTAARSHSGILGGSLLSIETEHRSVLDPLNELKGRGYAVTFLAVQNDGLLAAENFSSSLGADTFFVSVMLGNNEIGVLHDIQKLRGFTPAARTLFHCDATQALGKIALNVRELGVDLLSLSAHKIYGPKGVGALYVKRGEASARLRPILFGGGHESGLRSGTLNVASIVGFGKACEILTSELSTVNDHLTKATKAIWDGLNSQLPELFLNGSAGKRIPGNLNISFTGVDSAMLIGAISPKLAVSASSACTSQNKLPSFVLAALGLPEARQRSSIRIGIGRFTTDEEIDFAVRVLVETVKRLRTRSL